MNSSTPYTGPYYKSFKVGFCNGEHEIPSLRPMKCDYWGLPECFFNLRYVQGKIVDGKKHGPFSYYYQNGRMAVLEYYNNGILDGKCEVRDGDGAVYLSGTLRNGRKHGQFSYTHDNGQFGTSLTFVSGELDGPVEVFDSSGSLTRRGRYAAGLKVGLWEKYKNGKLEEKEQYNKAGQLDGVSEEYSVGKLHKRTSWKDGLKHGTVEVFENDGTTIRIRWKYEKNVSVEEETFTNGKLRSRKRYKGPRRRDQTEERFDVSGRLRESGNKCYDENGKEVDCWESDRSWDRDAAWE